MTLHLLSPDAPRLLATPERAVAGRRVLVELRGRFDSPIESWMLEWREDRRPQYRGPSFPRMPIEVSFPSPGDRNLVALDVTDRARPRPLAELLLPVEPAPKTDLAAFDPGRFGCKSWEEVFQRYEGRLRTVVAQYFPRDEDFQEELIQRTWFRAALKLGSFEFRSEGETRSWLVRKASWECLDALRGLREQGERSIELVGGLEPHARTDVYADLEAAFRDQLDAMKSRAAVAYFLEGRKVEEILDGLNAAAPDGLKISMDRIYKWLREAKDLARDEVDPLGGTRRLYRHHRSLETGEDA